MPREAPELFAHKEWLGQIQQVGLVVSPFVLVRRGVGIDQQRGVEGQTRINTLAPEEEKGDRSIAHFATFVREVLDWLPGILAGAPGGPELPSTLNVALPEHADVLAPSFAVVPTGVGANLQVCPKVRTRLKPCPYRYDF